METFRAPDGRALAYRVVGSGPKLVCHPGGPGFSGAELEDMGGLSAHRTLVILDPRGTGGSDAAGDYSLEGYADDIDGLRRHLGLDQIDLLGFSHGAIVAVAYAAQYPSHLGRLVLASGIAAMTEAVNEDLAPWVKSKSGAAWHADAVAALAEEERGDFDDPASLWQREAPLYFSDWDERYRPSVVAAGAGAKAGPLLAFNQAGFDVRSELSEISAPTLIITGRDDFLCGPPAAEGLARGIPHAQVVLLEGAGHMTFVERPEGFRDAVESFLASGG